MRSVQSGGTFDVAVIGGGITGTAVARDAAGRGLSVFLCEEGDLGGGASSATTKLLHGALDLMETFRLGAMREAVTERAILMRAAPHLVRPMRFLIPRHERQWPPLMLRLGLYAYDHVARSELPPSGLVDLAAEEGGVLHAHFAAAFAYSDCVADDSRLVVLNAIDARTRGAIIEPRLRCTVAERDGGRWRLSLECARTGQVSVAFAKILVNAAGAAAGDVLNHVVHARDHVRVRVTKAAHIVVRRPELPGDTAYALPTADGHIVFAVPYDAGAMLLGPVISDYAGDPFAAPVDHSDVAYLIDVAGQYFHAPIHADDVAWSFACVSALPDDPAALRSGRAVLIDAPPNVAPLISAFGGTLTTHRLLAEQVVDRMGKFRPIKPAWTADAPLPGGGFPPEDMGTIVRALATAYPFLGSAAAARLVRAYGTRASGILTGRRSTADFGRAYGGGLTEAEVEYLREEEWAETAEDILWRRSKLGLQCTAAEANALEHALAAPQPVLQTA